MQKIKGIERYTDEHGVEVAREAELFVIESAEDLALLLSFDDDPSMLETELLQSFNQLLAQARLPSRTMPPRTTPKFKQLVARQRFSSRGAEPRSKLEMKEHAA